MKLRPGRMEGIAESLMSDFNVFPCHKTTHGDAPEEQACMGALAYGLREYGQLPVLARLAIRSGQLDPKNLEKCMGKIEKPGEWEIDE